MADRFMEEALREARLALEEDEVPVGAVIVKDGQIIARGHNMRMQKNDPTSHAEMEVIRQAAAYLQDWRLTGCKLYVTLEPCVMCAGAIAQARLDAVIFGAFDAEFGCAGSQYNLPQDGTIGGHTVAAGGLMEEECAALMREYFEKRR